MELYSQVSYDEFRSALVNRRIRSISRISFEFERRSFRSNCILELQVDPGAVFHLMPSSDGERLRINLGAWKDPFSEHSAPDNEHYIGRHGKWTRIADLDLPEFSKLTGRFVTGVQRILSPSGKLAGIRLLGSGAVLVYCVAWDEGLILGDVIGAEMEALGFAVKDD